MNKRERERERENLWVLERKSQPKRVRAERKKI